jgi:NAD(P)-dependent dehydrogenase (short-subunit alcohol dehydrogenase family)
VRAGPPGAAGGGRVSGPAAGRLAGLTAVVTGGAGGIGQATVRRLAADGAQVAVLDRVTDGARAGLVLRADVTDAGSLAAAASHVTAEFGRCDLLIIAAGVAVAGAAADCTDADWDQVFAVNVRGAWLTYRAFLPVLNRPASVVTVASAAGLRPMPRLAAYSAAKAALIGLTRSIAVDYAAEGIRANCVCPGQIDTPLAAQVQRDRPPDERAAVAGFADYPVKRAGQPAEVAGAIAYLCGPEAGYVTGSVLAVDGGRTLH